MSGARIPMTCGEPWFSLLRDGVKTVEGRRQCPRWNALRVEDTLEIVESVGGSSFLARVVSIRSYDAPNALRAYLEGEGLERALPHPDVTTLEDGERVYTAFWSNRSIEAAGGMLAIEVRPLARAGDTP